MASRWWIPLHCLPWLLAGPSSPIHIRPTWPGSEPATVEASNPLKSHQSGVDDGFTSLNLSSSDCSSPIGSLDGTVQMVDEDGRISDFTTIQWQIGLGQTFCYQFQSQKESHHRGLIEVHFQSLRSVHAISNNYHFMLPKANADCFCDCPGGANRCNAFTDRCTDRSPNCRNIFSTDVQSSGCFLKFLKLSSSACCTLEVMPESDKRYRALQLSLPSILAQFQGVSVDWEVGLMVSSSGPRDSVPSGWYFLPEFEGHNLFGGVPINGLNEWDVQKLGWFKSDTRQDAMNQRNPLRAAFSPIIHNCARNSFEVVYSTEFINENQLSSARSLTDIFPFAESIQVWQRHVEVVHRESPLLVLTLHHEHEVDIMLKAERSYLSNFEGILHLDSTSNQYLNLTIYGARGTIQGQAIGFNSSQTLQISVGSTHTAAFHHRIKVTGLICERAEIVLTLHARGEKDGKIEKRLPCAITGFNRFEKVGMPSMQLRTIRGQGESGGDDAGWWCWWCGDSWSSWMGFGNGNVWDMVGMALILTFITIVTLSVILCCIKCCCCCLCR